MQDKFVLRNMNGIAMDDARSRFTALAVDGGRIVTVGNESSVGRFVEKGWPIRDLKGQTLLPGFIDTHQHLGLTGQVLNLSLIHI